MYGFSVRSRHWLEGTLFAGLDHFCSNLLGKTAQRRHAAFAVLCNVNENPVGSAGTLRLDHCSRHFLQGLKGDAPWSNKNTKFRGRIAVDRQLKGVLVNLF